MATSPAPTDNLPGYLGTNFPVPNDPNYYLGQTGLTSLMPSAFNSSSLAALFAPQGMSNEPWATQATNPFEQLFLQDSANATRLQRKKVPGMPDEANNAQMPE